MTPQPNGPLARRIAHPRGLTVPSAPEQPRTVAVAELFVAPWRRRLTARDETRRVMA